MGTENKRATTRDPIALACGIAYTVTALLAIATAGVYLAGAAGTAQGLALATTLALGFAMMAERRVEADPRSVPKSQPKEVHPVTTTPAPLTAATRQPAPEPRELSEADVWPLTQDVDPSRVLDGGRTRLGFSDLRRAPSLLADMLMAAAHRGASRREGRTPAEMSGAYQVHDDGIRYDLRLSVGPERKGPPAGDEDEEPPF